MILNHLWPKKFPLNRESEYKIWLKTVNPLIGGCPALALAKLLKDCGFKTKVIYLKEFSPKKYVLRYIRPDGLKAYHETNLFHKKQALKSGVKYKKRKIKLEEIKKWLKEYDFAILLVEARTLSKFLKNNFLHWILITDYKDNKFLVYDPLSKKKWLPEKLLNLAFDNVRKKIKCDNKIVLLSKS